MLNKDKRSLILSLVLGNGSLGMYRGGGAKRYGRLSIDHGIEQSDYQSWKAKLLSEIFNRDVKVRTGHNGKSVQISLCNNKFKAYHKFVYTNNKKDLAKILPFIRHPEMSLAIWLMDDGYVEQNGNRVGAKFRLFTCDQTLETQQKIISWFKDIFNVDIKINYQFKRSKNIHYPYLKFNQKDTLTLWSLIRDFILQFKSMRHKFRFVETLYQSENSKRIPCDQKHEDIVHT